MSTVNTVRPLTAPIVPNCPEWRALPRTQCQHPLSCFSGGASQMDLRFVLSPDHIWSPDLVSRSHPVPSPAAPGWTWHWLIPSLVSRPCYKHLTLLAMLTCCKAEPWLVRALPMWQLPLTPDSSSSGVQPHWHCSLTNTTKVYGNCSKIHFR